MPPAMTVRDVAQRLGISELAVYREVQKGQIPHFRISTRIRFDARTIEEWIEAGGSAAEQEPAGVA